MACTGYVLQAQSDDGKSLPWDLWLDPETRDFETIQAQVEEYFKDKDQGRGTGYKQWKRWEWMMMNRLDKDGQITNYDAHNFKVAEKYYAHTSQDQQRTFGGYWFPLAPTDGYILGNVGYNPGIGRVNVIAFHPTDNSIIYAGTPAGGLWRTSNEGVSWTPLTESIPRIGVSGIAINPDNPSIIYILTGDGDGADTYSVGVLRTTNGGATWNKTGLEFDANSLVRGYKLAMKPGDPTTLFAVTNNGLYRTENSGGDWDVVRSGSYRDLEFKPGNPETVYVCTSNSFHRSTMGGDAGTWTTTSSGLPCCETRVALAVSAAEPNWVYYLAGGGTSTGNFRGLYRSTNSGASFSTIITSPNILDGSLAGNDNCNDGCDQAGYDLAIAVDPNDADEVITGGINVWRCEDIDVSNTWNIIAHWNTNTVNSNNLEYTHADIHELVYQTNDRLWCGSDGGIFRSTNDGIDWTDRTSAGTANGLIGTQFYRIAGTASNSNILIGGTQDNGSNRWSGGNDITHFDGADGMDCMISQANSNTQFHMRQRGSLYRSTNAGSSITFIRPGSSRGAWVTPVDMDHSNSSEIWAGYRDTIYRSTNSGTTWTGFLPGGNQLDLFTYIWCAPSNSSVVYAATVDNLFKTTNNGTSWTNVTGTLPIGNTSNQQITGITTDFDNSGDVWVSVNGLVDGNKVYRSLDGGSTWTNYTADLPNVAVNCVVYDDNQVHDNAIYVGTDIGIFYRDGTLSNWIPFSTGLPRVPVFDMEVNTGAGVVRAGTFGRGIWTSNDWSDCPAGWTLTNANAPGTFPEGFRYYQSSGWIHSTRNFYGGEGTQVFYRADDYVRLDEGFRARLVEAFRAWNAPCGSGIPDVPLTADLPNEEELGVVLTIDDQETEGLIVGDPEVEALNRQKAQLAALRASADESHAALDFDPESKTINLIVKGATEVTVGIYSEDSEKERLIDSRQLSAGSHSIPVSYGEMGVGNYNLRVTFQGKHTDFPIQIQ